MSETAFAKSFLAALDSRPQKLSADHVEDPKNYPARPPVSLNAILFTSPSPFTKTTQEKADMVPRHEPQYILPKMPRAMSKAVKLAPGQERSVTVHVKSLRNPPLDMRLTSQPLNTSILDVKAAVSADTGIPTDKVKVLHRKKPVADSKVLGDLLGDDETSVEFSVMVLGGAATVAAAAAAAAASPAGAGAGAVETKTEKEAAASDAAVAQGTSGEAVLGTDAFWTDLRGFLSQRIRDEKITEELFGKFLSSWESSR